MITNLKRFYVLKSGITAPNGTVSSQIVNPNDPATYIVDGQVVVTNPAGKVLTTNNIVGTIEKEIQIRYRQGDSLLTSATIPVDKITSYKVSTYRPDLEKVTIIGYNGTDSTFTTDIVDGQEYMVTVNRFDTDFFMEVERPKTAIYTQGSNPFMVANLAKLGVSVSEQKNGEIVCSLADIIYKSFIKTITGYSSVDIPIKVERLADGAFTTTVATCTFSNESNLVVKTAHGLTAADVGKPFRVGSSNITTRPVYVIKEIVDVNSFKIDVPFQGISGNYNAYVNTTAPTVWGLVLTGVPYIHEIPNFYYKKVRFEIQANPYVTGLIRNYGINPNSAVQTKGLTNTISSVVAANVLIPNIEAYDGVGVAHAVQDNEYKRTEQGEERKFLNDSQRISKRKLVSEFNGDTCTYSILNIEWLNQWNQHTISTINDSGNITIPIPVTFNTTTTGITEANATAATYGFVTVLDALLNGKHAAQINVVTTY